MLVLSRKVNESIAMPDLGIEITVLRIDVDKVRLGIVAPDCVHVYRDEVLSRLDRSEVNGATKEQGGRRGTDQAAAAGPVYGNCSQGASGLAGGCRERPEGWND